MLRSVRKSKALWVGTVSLTLLLGGGARARAWGGGAKHDRLREVEQLERRWRTAALAGDAAAMDPMLAEDYVSVTMQGKVNTKSQQLRRMRDRLLVLRQMELRDVKIRFAGQVAIVTGRALILGSSAGLPIDGTYLYTQILHQLPDGAWTITNFEVSRCTPSVTATTAVRREAGQS